MKGIVLGIICICSGIAVIYRHKQLYSFFGDFERAEKAFGNSLVVYPLMGSLLIIVGILFLFGIGLPSGSIEAQFGE